MCGKPHPEGFRTMLHPDRVCRAAFWIQTAVYRRHRGPNGNQVFSVTLRRRRHDLKKHYWQNPWRLGGPAPTLDELGQVRDSELLRDGEPRPEIVPEAETELGTGLGQAEEGIPAIASDVAAGSAAHLAPGHLGADVVLRSVGVQRELGMVGHPE